MIIDDLIDKIKKMGNPTVMGLDPRYELIPEKIKNKYDNSHSGICKACLEFNKALIDSVYDIVPSVKPQVAFYEMLGLEGIKVLIETCKYAKEKGMIVILDAKRGDIGSTSKAYSNAYLTNREFLADFLTVNPYLGSDGILPFVEDCSKNDKGIFVLVKTSNPSSDELQNLKAENGKTIYEIVGELVEKWGEELRGKYGYSQVAAVVGATHPVQLKELREKMPHTFFLIPGYGAQGGKAKDIALAFDKNGIGGIVNNSRGLMTAYKSELWKDKYGDARFEEATRAEAIRMRDEIMNYIKK